MLRTILLALRILRKNPGFTLIAVLTIALGVGASTAIFSVTNAVLLRPLPYKDPGRLVVGGMDLQKRNVHGLPFSNADYLDLKNGTRNQFSDMAGVFTFQQVVARTDGTPEQITEAVVTTNFFGLMGARIVAGRDFDAQDGVPEPPAPAAGQNGQATGRGSRDTPPPQLPQMAVLSHEYFMKRYGGNPAILGHTLGNAGGPNQNPVIVGVLAPGFRLYFPPEDQVERGARCVGGEPAGLRRGQSQQLQHFSGGAAEGRSDGTAGAERRGLRWPRRAAGRFRWTLRSAIAITAGAHAAAPGGGGEAGDSGADGVGDLSAADCLRERGESAAGAGIAAGPGVCGARGDGREPAAADRRRCLRKHACWRVMGTAAWGWGWRGRGFGELRHLAPANLPRLDEIGIDGPVLVFTALAGLVAAVLFGLAPAWRASQPALMNVLRGVEPHFRPGQRRRAAQSAW